jgi:hypothetical protein
MNCASPFENARRAIAEGRAVPVPQLVNMERRQGAQQISDLSRNLSEGDLEALARAVEPRESALVLARQGDIPEARRLLAAAQAIIDQRPLPEEARVAARSFQTAAEAYTDFADGRLERASASLTEALSLCRQLRLAYRHRVEVRRIHLARNMVRVAWAGGSYAPAWSLSAKLLAYLWGTEAPWPLGENTDLETAEREELREDERVFLTDQVLSEAISTAFASSAPIDLPPWHLGEVQRAALPAAVREIEHICRELAAHRMTWLDPVSRFCRGGMGELPMTWHRLVRLVEDRAAEEAAAEHPASGSGGRAQA